MPIPQRTPFNDFLSVFAQSTVGSEMPVVRLPDNTQFAAQIGHLRFLLPHGQAHFRRSHLEGRLMRFSALGGV